MPPRDATRDEVVASASRIRPGREHARDAAGDEGDRATERGYRDDEEQRAYQRERGED